MGVASHVGSLRRVADCRLPIADWEEGEGPLPVLAVVGGLLGFGRLARLGLGLLGHWLGLWGGLDVFELVGDPLDLRVEGEGFGPGLACLGDLAELVEGVAEVVADDGVLVVAQGALDLFEGLLVLALAVVDPAEGVQVGAVEGVGLQGALDEGEGLVELDAADRVVGRRRRRGRPCGRRVGPFRCRRSA